MLLAHGSPRKRALKCLTTCNARRWARRKREAHERDAAEAEREKEWAAQQLAANEAALAEMRKFMPPSLPKLTGGQFDAEVKSIRHAWMGGDLAVESYHLK